MVPVKDLAAKSKLAKGTRVICRIDRDEWYTGAVDSESPLRIVFDDGSDSFPSVGELKYIKRMIVERSSPTALTRFQAEPLWRRYPVRVLYDAFNERRLRVDLRTHEKPWPELQTMLSDITTLVPFNRLLTLDFRSPRLEFCCGMESVPTDKLTPEIANTLIDSTVDAVARAAASCNLSVRRDGSQLVLSNAVVRQKIRVKLGAFANGQVYVQVLPF